ncbi:ShlB/FhaC/HecB family hemolysin secretion/activation protein [Rhodanobacter sp. Root480]|uniref:ShlB/FhaC/HecB family hemolysin secretion/activation protein n=1 Tax=Rhodanobacter sp. Root480 TaxID=1736542 RepID=UPI001F2BCBFA|nr:ShlB/FhaC/HecB family hemolysin secretion/activation protein [Rhodanobacter sp. Root480]
MAVSGRQAATINDCKGNVVRIACLAGALALALSGTVLAQETAPPPAAAPESGASAATPDMAAPQILISGIAPGDAVAAAAAQQAIDTEYNNAVAAAGGATTLSPAQWQAVADKVTAALQQAGHPDARAYLATQLMAFRPHAPAAVAQTTPATPAAPADNVVPPVRDRETDAAVSQQIAVRGFRVQGVGNHPDNDITPASIQALADAQFKALGGDATTPAQLDFTQLQEVADKITARYRNAGFIVATAFLPAQTVGDDKLIEIKVLEGTIGKIIVKGTKRYRPGVIAAPAEKLRGKPLRKSAVDTALLYDRDLPGVSVTSTFQPGSKTGETDLVMVAREAKRPFTFTTGVNNYGNELTGRYRAQLGATWLSPLGIGDSLAANVDYAFNPRNNVYGSLVYRAPTVVVPGLSAVIGATRSAMQINTGTFTALGVKGPSSLYFGGADWAFVNTDALKLQGTLRYIKEQSKLSTVGTTLSDQRFDVAELGFGMNHTDQRFHGIDLLQLAVRKSVKDRSRQPDLVSPDHARSFLSAKLSYTRLQFLTDRQRLYFKLAGQFTNDALVPLEQFGLGGPDSVRAYPISEGLADRGYYSSLEYHVDAPGFGDKVSPFYGRPWRELLEFEAFVDYGKGYPAGANRRNKTRSVTLNGIGAGLIFRLPQFHQFEFHLDGSVPTSRQRASDDNGYHIYSRFGFTF